MKNKVAPQKGGRRDTFFTKTKSFKSKRDHFRRPTYQRNDDLAQSTSNSASGDFFVKPAEKTKPSDSDAVSKYSNAKNAKPKRPEDNTQKRPFDKKQWRLKKYSKKYKLQQWEDQRKRTVLKEYYREIKDDQPKFDVKKIYEQHQSEFDDDDDGTERYDVAAEKCSLQRTSQEEETQNENNLNANLVDEAPPDQKPTSAKAKKGKAFKKAHLEFQRIKEEKQQKKQEFLKKKADRDEALKVYKQKKSEKFKRLNRKTKKGQPIMKDRMEMLLEQIQRNMT